ncbi:MAG: sugar ABC transporter ATP-binding protein, partial [Pseudomonadota bacterium]
MHGRAAPALKMANITKHFGGVRALDSVDFIVETGEVHCLAGENGSGKSTLIKIATGVYSAEAGADIEIGGTVVARPTPGLARRLGIAVIWQDLALFPEMTVAENIAIESVLGATPHVISRAEMRRAARRVLTRLGVDLDLAAPVRELPIAKRQIVAIARALVADVKLIFMDEPTASLTQTETDYLLRIVRTLSADGVAVVFVSHRLAEVLEISRAVTVLRDGKRVGVFPTEGMTQSRLTELMTGQSFDSAVAARDTEGAPVLELTGLTRRGEYENIHLTIRKGEIVGLTGLIGAGRTELGLTLFGMTVADAGEMKLDGKPVAFRENGDAIRAGVAYVSEDRLSLGLIQPQSIADNIAITVLDKLTAGLIRPARKRALVNRWIDDLKIKIGTPEDPVATLSGG